MPDFNKAKDAGNFLFRFTRENPKAYNIIVAVVFVLWTALLVKLMWG